MHSLLHLYYRATTEIMNMQYMYIYIYICSKVNIWNVSCAEATALFSNHERMLLWKCRSLRTQNISTWGGLKPPTFGFMQARHLLSHVLEYWFWQCRYFWSILNINFRLTNGCSCASVEVLKTENVSTGGRLEPSTFTFMPHTFTVWAIRARHLLSHVLEY